MRVRRRRNVHRDIVSMAFVVAQRVRKRAVLVRLRKKAADMMVFVDPSSPIPIPIMNAPPIATVQAHVRKYLPMAVRARRVPPVLPDSARMASVAIAHVPERARLAAPQKRAKGQMAFVGQLRPPRIPTMNVPVAIAADLARACITMVSVVQLPMNACRAIASTESVVAMPVMERVIHVQP